MADQDHPELRLDPEREDDVRRLLAEARHDEPIPEDVAARLDRVLAQLAAEDAADSPSLADLAVQRRRRRARNLLVAAVAVGVVGVGLGQLGRDDDPTMYSGAGPASAGADTAAVLEDLSSAESSAEEPARLSQRRPAPEPTSSVPLVVGDDDLGAVAEQEAAAVVHDFSGSANAPEDPSQSPGALDNDLKRDLADVEAAGSWFICKAAPFGPGRLVAVQYLGGPAVLALRPPTGDSVVAELLRCGTGAVLRSATIPAS